MASLRSPNRVSMGDMALLRDEQLSSTRRLARWLFLALLFIIQQACHTYTTYKIGPGPEVSRDVAVREAVSRNITINGAKLDRPLKLSQVHLPEYSDALIDANVQGVVLARFTIRPDGTVSGISIDGSPPFSLTTLARQSLSEWRFEPPMRNGEAVSVFAAYRFVFKIAP